MKFHDNTFGRRERKTVFLSFLAAATALQLTSCADHAQIPELPPIAETSSILETEIGTLMTSQTIVSEETAARTETQTAETVSPAPVPDTAVTEEPAQSEEETHPQIRTEISEEIITVPYQTQYDYSLDYEEGVRIKQRAGVNGKIKVTTVTTYEGDTVVDVSEQREVITEKSDALIIIGIQSVITERTETKKGNTVAFTTEYIKDDTLYEDERYTVTAGQNGYTLYTYRVTYKNDKETARTLLSSSVVSPVSETVRIGTKPVTTETTETVREDEVAYTTRYEYDDSLELGVKKLKTAGVDGYTERVYRITYYKGNESARTVVSEKTVAPVEEVILVGTKKEEAYYMPFRDAAHGGYDYPVTQSFSSSHRALDFGVWYGDPICAIKSGTVIAAYNEGYFSTDNILWTYGTYVVIEHEDGMRSYYAHLKSKTVSVGQKVSGGQVIGYSGNTGRVNPAPTTSNPLAGTHLHFEIRIKQGSSYVTTDPRKYLPYWN